MVSLNRRFNRVFVSLLAIPLLLAFVLMSWLSSKALLDTVSNQNRDLMAQVAQSIENEVNAASVLAATLVYDPEIQEAAQEWAEDQAVPRRIAAAWKMSERLGSIFTVANRFGAIVIYMRDGTTIPVSNYPNIRSFFLSDQSLWNRARAQPNQVIVADNLSGVTENGGSRFILSALISPSEAQGGRAIDGILVMFRLPYLDQFTTPDPQSATKLLILGRDGHTLLSNLSTALTDRERAALRTMPEGNSQTKLAGQPYLVNSRGLGSAAWTLVMAMDQGMVTSRIMGYLWFIYPGLVLVFGLFLVYSMVFFSRVTRPIEVVMDNMRRFASGQTPLPVRLDGIVELEALSGNFDAMVAEIRRLEDERKRQSDRRLEAEIRALQFQINPHFVANTLNSIRMMALVARNDGIRDMTQALIRILADSYAGTDSLTVLAAEVENIKNYLFIMKVRFGEHFQVAWDLAPDTLECRVLRMGLQPLVENAILHGFAGLGTPGLLTIRSFREDQGKILVLEVVDNGVGMDPFRAEGLLAARAPEVPGQGDEGQETFNKIGIRNVHDRIRLNFGPEFGLRVESRLGSGTRVRMTLPVQENR